MDYRKKESLLKWGILLIAGILSFSTRLFSVLRFESASTFFLKLLNSLNDVVLIISFLFVFNFLQIIHEFDPYFNFRTTKFLAEEGE